MRGPRRQVPGARPARLACLLLWGMALLAGCAFQSGEQTIAYLQDGQLRTINPDGSSATMLARGVVGFAWSPDHHLLVYRTGSVGAPPSFETAAPDALGSLNVTSADGGGTVTITPASAGVTRSDAWWDASGNRLIYREALASAAGQPPAVPLYVLSQSDQPVGIARVFLQGAGGMPAVSPDGMQVAWVDAAGGVHLGKPGAGGQVIATGALLTLPDGTRPARLLWQPRHQALLFCAPASDGQTALVVTDLAGHARTLGDAAALLDVAFAPDGALLLVRTGTAFAVWRAGTSPATTVYTWDESDPNALAWWSPDGRSVLVRDRDGLWLSDPQARTTRQLLASAAGAPLAGAGTWRPLAESPWSPDGTRIVFADPGSGVWQGRPLAQPGSGGGLYVAAIAGTAPPHLIASGQIAWPTWSELDPGASLLVGA